MSIFDEIVLPLLGLGGAVSGWIEGGKEQEAERIAKLSDRCAICGTSDFLWSKSEIKQSLSHHDFYSLETGNDYIFRYLLLKGKEIKERTCVCHDCFDNAVEEIDDLYQKAKANMCNVRAFSVNYMGYIPVDLERGTLNWSMSFNYSPAELQENLRVRASFYGYSLVYNIRYHRGKAECTFGHSKPRNGYKKNYRDR